MSYDSIFKYIYNNGRYHYDENKNKDNFKIPAK